MITDKQAGLLKSLVDNLVTAAIEDSWKGVGDPADTPAIEAELIIARHEFNKFITEITEAK